jgi:hypothetical protein
MKKVHSCVFDKKVGESNQFDHILVQALFINPNTNKFISCDDFWDYHRKTRVEKKEKNKNKLISGISRLLYKKK